MDGRIAVGDDHVAQHTAGTFAGDKVDGEIADAHDRSRISGTLDGNGLAQITDIFIVSSRPDQDGIKVAY